MCTGNVTLPTVMALFCQYCSQVKRLVPEINDGRVPAAFNSAGTLDETPIGTGRKQLLPTNHMSSYVLRRNPNLFYTVLFTLITLPVAVTLLAFEKSWKYFSETGYLLSACSVLCQPVELYAAGTQPSLPVSVSSDFMVLCKCFKKLYLLHFTL